MVSVLARGSPDPDLLYADAKTYQSVLRLDRGCPWESALQSRNAYIQECQAQNVPPSAKSGFYIDKKKHGKDGRISLPLTATQFDGEANDSTRKTLTLDIWPSKGLRENFRHH